MGCRTSPAGRQEPVPAEWVIPSRAAAIALVYGAQGFSTSKLVDFVRRDPQLITHLAVYCEKSAQTEALMETVASAERSGSAQTAPTGPQPFTLTRLARRRRDNVGTPPFARASLRDLRKRFV